MSELPTLWTAKEIADWMQYKPEHVRKNIVTLPDFPRAFNPSGKLHGVKRWFADDVVDWARKKTT